MAVTVIPNVTNWTVTPQNGQSGYFTLMNIWLGQSTSVIASLQTAITAQNTANSEINALAIQTENNAIIATGLANYQGVWSNLITYSKGWSVSVGGLYYTSKVDNNLNHIVTDTNFWLYNPINDKVNNNSNEIIAGIKTFTSSPTVPTPATGDRSTKVATTALFDNEFVKSLAVNGYQKLPSGLIIQWGLLDARSTSGYATVTLPIAFLNNLFAVSAIRTGGSWDGTSFWNLNSSTLSSLTFQMGNVTTSTGRYIAIGN